MPEHPALPVLRLALERLRRGWCQYTPARTKTGLMCHPWHKRARQWCLSGATDDGGDCKTFDARQEAMAQLYDTLIADGVSAPPTLWNDSCERTQEQVIDLVSRTIARLESADA
jgi:hypothetical protein